VTSGLARASGRDPRCTGKCKGDRAAWESPAVQIQTANGLRLACPCCGFTLTRSTTEEVGRPPNLNPEIEDLTVRFEDNVCQYDVVLSKEIRPRK
jgi:hypothetical protein